MARIKVEQNSFTQGELGQYFDTRVDLDLYRAGAKTVENFMVLPQGGLLKRPGFELIDDNPGTDHTAGDDLGFNTGSRLIPFKFSTEQEYVLVFEPSGDASVNSKFHVYRNGAHAATVQDSDCFWHSEAILDELTFAQTFDTMIICHKDFEPKQIQRTGHTSWTITPVVFVQKPFANFDTGLTLTPSNKTVGTHSITASADASSYIEAGDRIRINGGYYTVSSVSTTTINGTVDVELGSTDAAGPNEWEITAFGSLRGFPRSVTFHQNRLIFGGSRDKPQTVFGSQTGDFFNFLPTVDNAITDDSGFVFTIGSDQVNVIKHLHSQQTLFIFTTGGEFEMVGSPVTPTNVNIRLQTRYGHADGGVRPILVDNEVLFVSANGRELRGFVFDFNSDSYYAENRTIIAHDVLDNPDDITFLRAFKNTNQNYVFLANENGELACLSINVRRNVIGWSRFKTDGKFLKCLAINDNDTTPPTQRLYALTQRDYTKDDGSTATAIFLERMTENTIYLDSWQEKSDSGHTTVTGIYHLKNRTVRVVTDGLVHANVSVGTRAQTANITLNDTSSNTQVGLGYTGTLTTMTIPVVLNGQNYRGEEHRKITGYVNLNNTQDLTVDGQTIDFRSLGSGLLDVPITPFTGTVKKYISGITNDPALTVTTAEPLQATILGVTTELEVGDG
jgi:hypothetical protein